MEEDYYTETTNYEEGGQPPEQTEKPKEQAVPDHQESSKEES